MDVSAQTMQCACSSETELMSMFHDAVLGGFVQVSPGEDTRCLRGDAAPEEKGASRKCSDQESLSNSLRSRRERVLKNRTELRHDEKAFSNVEEVVLKVSTWGVRISVHPQVPLNLNLAICT